jgi:hypothetical protein
MFEYFNGFWKWAENNGEKTSPNITAMYFYLVHINNSLGWRESFTITSTHAMNYLGIGAFNTYKNTIDKLEEHGLIIIVERSKNQFTCTRVALSKMLKANDKASSKQLKKQVESIVENKVSIHKTLQNDKDLLNNKDYKDENEISINVSKKIENDISKWFKRCSENEFINEVQKFRNENPNNGYPEILFKDFINHYTTPNENGGIRVNQFSSFGIKNKLYEWKEDIKHAGKYEIKTPKKRIHYE